MRTAGRVMVLGTLALVAALLLAACDDGATNPGGLGPPEPSTLSAPEEYEGPTGPAKPSSTDDAAGLGDDAPGITDDAKETADEAWAKVKELYAAAKEAGEKVPGGVAEWVVEDLRKVGAWDYKVVTVSQHTDEHIAEQLTRLGHERWECYFVQDLPSGKLRMFLKRTRRSRIGLAIERDLTRLAPVHDEDAEDGGADGDDGGMTPRRND